MSITRSAGVLAILAGLLAWAAIAQVSRQTAPAALAIPQYVAMGSSFAAGPGILPTVPGNPRGCARSAQNYAHVMAQLRHLSLVDATCSGATTNDVLHSGQFQLPPQLDAITSQTQLVTVTIGGNDVFFMSNLIALACVTDAATQQSSAAGCKVAPDNLVEDRFAKLGDALHQIVAGARSRSPNVRVVFVNYFTVLPAQGTCDRVHLTAIQADQMRGIAARLADITQKVATETGSGLFDLGALSRGHDSCSGDPWLMGASRKSGSYVPPFHPTPDAMKAVGKALAAYPGLMK